jgi:hypothetical protein
MNHRFPLRKSSKTASFLSEWLIVAHHRQYNLRNVVRKFKAADNQPVSSFLPAMHRSPFCTKLLVLPGMISSSSLAKLSLLSFSI